MAPLPSPPPAHTCAHMLALPPSSPLCGAGPLPLPVPLRLHLLKQPRGQAVRAARHNPRAPPLLQGPPGGPRPQLGRLGMEGEGNERHGGLGCQLEQVHQQPSRP